MEEDEDLSLRSGGVSSESRRQCRVTRWLPPARQPHLLPSGSGEHGTWDKSVSVAGLCWLLDPRSHGSAGHVLGCGSTARASSSHTPRKANLQVTGDVTRGTRAV